MKRMIYQLMLMACIVMTSATTHAQVAEFEKYSDVKDVTYVYISHAMLQLAGKIAAPTVPGMDVGAIISKLDAIQIVTAEKKEVRTKLKNDVSSTIKKGKYELLMKIDEDDERVRIYFKDGKQKAVIIMSTDEQNETSIIIFSGKFSLDDIQMKKK